MGLSTSHGFLLTVSGLFRASCSFLVVYIAEEKKLPQIFKSDYLESSTLNSKHSTKMSGQEVTVVTIITPKPGKIDEVSFQKLQRSHWERGAMG
jgi:hypothetical protein